MASPLSLSDIKSAVKSATSQFTGKKDDQLTALINMVYLSEILGMEKLHPWFWLLTRDRTIKCKPPVDIIGITAANPGVVETSAAHGLALDDIVHFYGVGGMTQLNERFAEVISVGDTTHFSLSIDTSAFTAYTSGGKAYHRGLVFTDNTVENIITAGWTGYNDPMKEVYPEEFENNTRFHNRDTTASPPTHYLFEKEILSVTGTSAQEKIIWSPAPSAEHSMRLLYEKKAIRLSGDDDVPLIPERFHDAVVAGCVARLTEKKDAKVGIEDQSLWPKIYSGHLSAIKQYNQEYWENVNRKKPVRPYML